MPTPPRTITHDGQTRTIEEWADLLRIPANTIRSRIDKQGWPISRALSVPVDGRFSKRAKKRPVGSPRPCPELKRHAVRGSAYATWWAGGKQHYRYFGAWGSPESIRDYQRFAAEWIAGYTVPESPLGAGLLVAEVAAKFMPWAESHYVKNGRATSHVHRFRSALRGLIKGHGERLANQFSPDDLRALVASWVAAGLSRRTVNEYQWRVVFVFSWAVTRFGGAVHPDTVARLERVEKQESGRSAAPDNTPKRSAPLADVEAAIPFLHPEPTKRAIFEAMVRLQLVSGLRPGELCAMTPGHLDRTRGDLWRYEPHDHKNRHRGARRVVWIGPRGQAILATLLAGLANDSPVFGYARAAGCERAGITVNHYRARVAAACRAAGVTPWHPHQLRHNRATELQRRYESDEAVRVGIGDTPEVARQIYVDDPAEAVAKRISQETG
jgi:site-specific recombinase XerC